MLQSGAAQQDLKEVCPQFQPSLSHAYIVLTNGEIYTEAAVFILHPVLSSNICFENDINR